VRSRIRALTLASALLLALPTAGPARARDGTPRVAVYAIRIDPGAPLEQGAWNSGYGGGVDVTWPLPRTGGLLAVFGGAEASSLHSGVRAAVDTANGERVEHHMDQLYGRLFIGGELGPHGDGTLEPYANFALSMIAYGYFDDVQITAGDASSELLVSQHEMGVGWSAGAGCEPELQPLRRHRRRALPAPVRHAAPARQRRRARRARVHAVPHRW
jgi:hypothetical protein